MKKIGLLCLARDTFDKELAAQTAKAARAQVADFGVIGDGAPLADASSAVAAARRLLREEGAEALLIAQLTFTDAAAISQIAAESSAPLILWAFPEPRGGGRLRLNSLCGINLAAHALGRRGRTCAHLFCAPDELTVTMLQNALSPDAADFQETNAASEKMPAIDDAARIQARRALAALAGARFARIGIPPPGFDTCESDPAFLRRVFGAEVCELNLNQLFAAADATPADEIRRLRAEAQTALANFDEIDSTAADKTLRLRAALANLAKEGRWSGAAVRCWPECFTEFGGACCGALSALSGGGLACACEADINGALSARLLQELCGGPAMLADWVDCAADGSAAFWHCGCAPPQMAAWPMRAAIHSNRKMPLLCEFAFKPGVVTIMRLSFARNRPQIAAARAEMLAVKRPYAGTCGVLRFAAPAQEVFNRAMHAGLEHHYAFAYGDALAACAAAAEIAGLPFTPL